MPGWLIAILVALVGLSGALIGTLARIAHERGAELRARMLDAADDFVSSVTVAHEAIESAALPTGLWVEIAWMEISDAMREDRQKKVEAAHATASSAWERSRQRVPRIGLLFGVDSPAAEAAKRTDDALGQVLVGLSKAYAESHDPVAEPLDENRILEEATERLRTATSRLREFSSNAHAAITRWRPFWSPN